MTGPAPAIAQLIIRRAAVNEYYRAAVETPEYREAIALHDWATRRVADLRPAPQLPLPESVDDDLDQWREIARRLAAAEEERRIDHNALTALARKQESRIQGVIYQKERLLLSLGRDLDDIMADAAEVVARLDGAANAAQVIELGVVDAWQELPALRGQYESNRQAQYWVMAGNARVIHCRSEWLPDDELATDLAIANLDQVFPSLKTCAAKQRYPALGQPTATAMASRSDRAAGLDLHERRKSVVPDHSAARPAQSRIDAPCGVPCPSLQTPSSTTPAASHLPTSRSSRSSAIRCRRNLNPSSSICRLPGTKGTG